MVKKLVGKNTAEITDHNEILKEIYDFYSSLFSRKIDKTMSDCQIFLDSLQIPVISDQHKQACEKDIAVEDLWNSLSSMSGGKSPGNDGLTIEFYKFSISRQISRIFLSPLFAILVLLESSQPLSGKQSLSF